MNICAFPDRTGYAPKNERWHAIDVDTYDGAEDAGPQFVGYGRTKDDAILDLIEQLLEEGVLTLTDRRELRHIHAIGLKLWREGAR